jgi:hypothetical protein
MLQVLSAAMLGLNAKKVGTTTFETRLHVPMGSHDLPCWRSLPAGESRDPPATYFWEV